MLNRTGDIQRNVILGVNSRSGFHPLKVNISR